MKRPLTEQMNGWENSANSNIGKLMALKLAIGAISGLNSTWPKPHVLHTLEEPLQSSGTHTSQPVCLQCSLKLTRCVLIKCSPAGLFPAESMWYKLLYHLQAPPESYRTFLQLATKAPTPIRMRGTLEPEGEFLNSLGSSHPNCSGLSSPFDISSLDCMMIGIPPQPRTHLQNQLTYQQF